MATPRMTVRHVLLDPTMERAVATTAQMFGLSEATVVTLIRVGLPMMAQLADDDPDLFKRMHAATRADLPEPVLDYYIRLALNPTLRQSVVDDYKATYGFMLDLVIREAARQAGITDGQARDVLAAILPAVNHVLIQAWRFDDETSFARQLKELYA